MEKKDHLSIQMIKCFFCLLEGEVGGMGHGGFSIPL